MSDHLDIQKLIQEVVFLQKDLSKVATLVDRLDITLEKLAEVTSTLSQLLAIQGNRLENQEKISAKLENIIETRRQDTNDSFKEMYRNMEDLEKNLKKDVVENEKRILSEIRSLCKRFEEQQENTNKRIDKFEKVIWILIGGGTILTWFLNNPQVLSAIPV